jgi:hypothetical protein
MHTPFSFLFSVPQKEEKVNQKTLPRLDNARARVLYSKKNKKMRGHSYEKKLLDL